MSRADVEADIRETLGLVPSFWSGVPDSLIESEWTSFRAIELAEAARLFGVEVGAPAHGVPGHERGLGDLLLGGAGARMALALTRADAGSPAEAGEHLARVLDGYDRGIDRATEGVD
jgi:hypothetical protein